MNDTTADADVNETIRCIVKRTRFLEQLAHGPTDKRDLEETLGVSRSTVYKAVRELEERSLVEQNADEVLFSLYGRLLFERYRSFAETASDVCDRRDLLSALPPDAPVTPDLLAGAEVVRSEPVAPDRPLDYLEDLIRDAERVVGLAPAMFRRYVELFHDDLVSGELPTDILFERSVVEHVRERYPDRFRESLGTDCCSLWGTDESLPFGLVLTEGEREEVVVVVYDEGRPVGVIVNDTPAALDWGRDAFESYREDATRVDERG